MGIENEIALSPMKNPAINNPAAMQQPHAAGVRNSGPAMPSFEHLKRLEAAAGEAAKPRGKHLRATLLDGHYTEAEADKIVRACNEYADLVAFKEAAENRHADMIFEQVALKRHNAALVAALEEIENRAKQTEGFSPTGVETECLRVARAALQSARSLTAGE